MRLVLLVFLTLLASTVKAQDEDLGPEILHLPELERTAEQGILRPVPIAVELPRRLAAEARRVLVHYRLWGEPDWTTLELTRHSTDPRYEGAIPCLEVSTVTGDLRYHLSIRDERGKIIAAAGSRAEPFIVRIKHDTTLARNQRSAPKCPDPADCPRGLLGCPSERIIDIACDSDADCDGGQSCSWRGFCEDAHRDDDWLSLSVQQDIGVIAATGACTIAAQEREGTACVRRDGQQYTGNPVLTDEPPALGRGPTRIVIGYERLIFYDTSIGLRASWAVAGEGFTDRDGTTFVPFSVVARLRRWFGADPFATTRLRGYLSLAGGYSMVDVEATARVREDPTAPSVQGGNDLVQEVTLYKRAGDALLGGGAGLSLPLTAGVALNADITVAAAFPFVALVLSPSAGIEVGF